MRDALIRAQIDKESHLLQVVCRHNVLWDAARVKSEKDRRREERVTRFCVGRDGRARPQGRGAARCRRLPDRTWIGSCLQADVTRVRRIRGGQDRETDRHHRVEKALLLWLSWRGRQTVHVVMLAFAPASA